MCSLKLRFSLFLGTLEANTSILLEIRLGFCDLAVVVNGMWVEVMSGPSRLGHKDSC